MGMLFTHILFEKLPHWFKVEDTFGLLVTRGVGAVFVGLGAVCCTSYFVFETIKFLKGLSKPQ